MTWVDFYAMCDKLVAKGITPLAIGLGGGSWTWQLPVFEGIFAGMTGATNYTNYFTGEGNRDDPDMESALNVSSTLVKKYSDVNLGDTAALKRQWSDACAQLESGKAAMTIMGDWAKGYFTSNGWEPGTDFNQIMVPSAEPLFVFSTDVLGLPKGAPAAGSILLHNTFQTPVDNQLLSIATDGTALGFIIDGDVTAMLNVIHQNYAYLSPAASQ
jgi:glucose/mannose transport system substrate-binding protein